MQSTARSRNSGNRVDQSNGGVVMRKGPWMAEEDEILLEYVRKHGPRDWSSIRSKGLLPRTGKSCRLRWVNKLKPDLKSGCKFSPEEERIVIALQEKLGNKWARIATYLPGRTDNDVKNFWSTRQKKLARILNLHLPSKSIKNHIKVPDSKQPPTFEVVSLDLVPFGDETSSSQYTQSSCNYDNHDASDMIQMPEMLNQTLFHPQDVTLPLLESALEWDPLQLQFDQLQNPTLDFPIFLEAPVLVPGLEDMSFGNTEGFPFCDVGVGKHAMIKAEDHSGTPDCFFDDFPMDMFDYLEQTVPQPTSYSAW